MQDLEAVESRTCTSKEERRHAQVKSVPCAEGGDMEISSHNFRAYVATKLPATCWQLDQ